ncbi:MAG: hypothetical protein LBL90_12750 [Prevotellaceae bacterium]|jgi:hypothetical protein|nr:hypothetical protein [Prevotellaceae bacterium]
MEYDGVYQFGNKNIPRNMEHAAGVCKRILLKKQKLENRPYPVLLAAHPLVYTLGRNGTKTIYWQVYYNCGRIKRKLLGLTGEGVSRFTVTDNWLFTLLLIWSIIN